MAAVAKEQRERVARERRKPRVVEPEDEDEEMEEPEDTEDNTVRRSRTRRVETPAKKVVEESEDEDEENGEEEEPEEEAPKPRRRRSRAVVEEEDEDEQPAKALSKAKTAVVDDDEDEEPTPRKRAGRRGHDEEAVAADSKKFWQDLIESMEAGQSFTVTKVAEDQYTIGKVAQAVVGRGRVRRQKTQEYQDWVSEWRNKTYDQKVKYAQKLGLEWRRHENPRIDVMALTKVVRDHLGISKYAE